jgi:hypothetical protein
MMGINLPMHRPSSDFTLAVKGPVLLHQFPESFL